MLQAQTGHHGGGGRRVSREQLSSRASRRSAWRKSLGFLRILERRASNNLRRRPLLRAEIKAGSRGLELRSHYRQMFSPSPCRRSDPLQKTCRMIYRMTGRDRAVYLSRHSLSPRSVYYWRSASFLVNGNRAFSKAGSVNGLKALHVGNTFLTTVL